MKNAKARIILASSSPRRQEILEGLKLDFIVHPSEVEERIPLDMLPEDIVEHLSFMKAESVSKHYNNEIVIGSDTIVVLGGEILGKPHNNEAAFSMINKLQGHEHTVFTGVAVIDSSSREYKVSHCSTKVTIKSLSEDQIKRYIATGEPMDKAGSYAIQGFGAMIVEKINGDYFTVVGLPIHLLSEMLEDFGVHIY